MKAVITCALLTVLSLSTSFSQLIPLEYSADGKYYLCWDTTQASYLAAMIGDRQAYDSIITNLENNITDLRLKLEAKDTRIANLEKDQQLGNQQTAILSDALRKANRLIRWLKLQSKVLAGTAAAILLYSLTIGSQK